MSRTSRLILALVSLVLLTAVFLLQRVDVAAALVHATLEHPDARFVFNKTLRFLLNDLACLMLIIAIFNDRKHLQIGFLLFLAELTVLLPIYFLLKLSYEGPDESSSPLLSQLHRMIVNPLLMIILISALYYQRWQERRAAK